MRDCQEQDGPSPNLGPDCDGCITIDALEDDDDDSDVNNDDDNNDDDDSLDDQNGD